MSLLNKIFRNTHKQQASRDVNEGIFKEYDIRGIYGSTLFDDDAFLIGRAVVTNDVKNVIIGYDGRLSSISLAKNMIRGLVRAGAHVTNIGLCHTPLVSFAVATDNFDLGIMVTGSHNPKEHNGFKFNNKESSIFGEEIKKIYERIRNGVFNEGTGCEILRQNYYQRNYVRNILDSVAISCSVKVAWDVGNGATSSIVKDIISKLPGQHVIINDEIDGAFPGRGPDPTLTECMQKLKDLVQQESFDLCFAFDGDGDRLVVVTKQVGYLLGDQLLAIFARSILAENIDARIIVDTKTSSTVISDIKMHAGNVVMERSGHSIIKSRMKTEGAILAGEMSGHFFFADKWYGFDDGVYAAIRFLEIYTAAVHNGNDVLNNLPVGFSSPEFRLSCANKFDVINNIKAYLQERKINYLDIDGVRVECELGWWLIRASNTQEQLTVRVEGTSQKNFHNLLLDVESILNNNGLIFMPPAT